jgi:hypothetical protein
MSLSTQVQPKRGYLAQVLTVPPLIYPFQYNPSQINDSRKLNWQERSPTPRTSGSSMLGSVLGSLKPALEATGKTLSGSTLKSFKADADRTVNFKFLVDGRELRPGEPARRRPASGSILGDLAIIRSFAYPQMLDVLALAGAVGGGADWNKVFFNEPPPAVLVFGSTSVDGYVTDLRITETQFNADLDPVRAEIEITMVERIDSLSFVVDAVKRIGRTFYDTAYEDIGQVLF